MKKILLFSLIVVLLSACVAGDGSSSLSHPAGFFTGIWHGWMAPIALILGFFNRDIRIYEVFNTGWWYDLGFYMAIISGFGGLAFSRKRHKDTF